MDRRAKLLWMREILDRLVDCCDQWQEEEQPNSYLAELVERDLDQFQRVCRQLLREERTSGRDTAAAA